MEEVKGEIKESMPEKDIEKRKSKLKEFFFGWVKDNYDKAFLFLFVVSCIIGLIVFFITKGQPLWYDLAGYMSTAKRLALGLNINDIWYYRRGFFWVLFSAFFFKINIGEIGIQFTGVLFYLGIISATYFILRDMFNKKVALFASILISFSWVILFYIGRSMTELPSTFFLLISLFFFWKGYILKKGNKFLYLFGLFYAIAVATRMELLMFALPILIFILVNQKFKAFIDKKLWITLGIFLLVIMPNFILYSLHYGNFIKDIMTYYFGVGAVQAGVSSSASAKTFFNLFDYFKDLPYALTTFILVPFLMGVVYFFTDLVIGIDKIFKDSEIQKKLLIFLWIIIPFFILGWITDPTEERYLIPTFPFLFLIAAIPFIKLEDFLIKHFKFKKILAIVLSVLLLLLLIIPGVSFANNLINDKKTSYLEVEQSALWLKANSNPNDVVVTQSFPYFTYYAERTSYPFALNTFGVHYQDANLSKYPPGEIGFNEFVQEQRPDYLMLSIFEPHDTWMYDYPQNHSDILKPIKAFYQSGSQQPAVVIYKFNYPTNYLTATK